ncbi:MAG: PQQ-dependent sugar dehydrogenase [Acidimicrobiia bacterium]|nr:PQQ-dependent sugar dehydrogenase [Acidimicrobiia bacterium]
MESIVGTVAKVPRRLVTALFVLALVAAACGGSSHSNHLERASGPSPSESTAPPSTTSTVPVTTAVPVATSAPSTTRRPASTTPRSTGAPAAPAGPSLTAIHVRLTPVAPISGALALAVRPGDGTLYIATKSGQVRAIRGGQVDPAPVLDLSGQVSTGSEQGLLGLAFSADGSHVYASYTDNNGDTNVADYAMNGTSANPGTRRQLLFVHQPFPNHNGGNLVLGPDGMLWLGLGDGGSEGDPNNTAQNPNTPLGKMLRVDPATGQYTQWALGFRNPWRYSFDRATGSLWIGDVGQDSWEEIDFAPGVSSAGMNFGWSRFEGNHLYKPSEPAPGAVPPVYEYSHAGGNCAVTGGYVYRGARIPAMDGVYLFGDFCVGHVFAFANGQARDLGIAAGNLASFGQDANGELYVLSLSDGVFRIDPA